MKKYHIEPYHNQIVDGHFRQGKTLKSVCKELDINYEATKRYLKEKGIKPEIRNAYEDLRRQKFGSLKPLEYVISEEKNRYGWKKGRWKCKCDCGNIVLCLSGSLKDGSLLTCGCKNKGYNKTIPGYWYSGKKAVARRKNIIWDIEYKDIYDLFKSQKGLCSLSGKPLSFSKSSKTPTLTNCSIDRINSCIGYKKNNIRLIDKRVNFIKNRYTDDELLTWCAYIYNYQNGIENSDCRPDFISDRFIKRYTRLCKHNAKSRNRKFLISEQDIKKLFEKQNGRCGISGLPLITAKNDKEWNTRSNYKLSLDRINSSKDYTIDNIELLCNKVNMMKYNIGRLEFIELCCSIYMHNKGHKI